MTVAETAMFFSGLLGYALALLFVVRYLRVRRARDLSIARTLAMVSVFLHGAFLVYHGIREQAFPITNLFEAVVFVGLILILVGLGIDLLRSMPLVTAATIPMILPIYVTALAFLPQQTQMPSMSFLIGIHTLVTLLSYAAFGLAFIMGLIYLFEHRQLKGGTQSRMFEILPSIEVIYKFNVRAVMAGLVLLTAGILMGYLYARTSVDLKSGWRMDPKIWLSTFTWAAYVVVWALSFVPSMRGRRIAMASVLCFGLVMLTLMASLFWESFHRFV